MLPTSSKIKHRLIKNMNEHIKQMMEMKSPVVQGIKRYFVFEGDKLGVIRFDGSTSISEIKRHEATALITKEEAAVSGIAKVTEDISTQLADAQTKTIFETLDKAVESVGNKIDGGGKPFSPELFLAAMDNISIDFEDDMPKLPTIVCGPQMMERFKKIIEKAMTTEPYKTQYETMMARKKREFDEREASRKLVD